jgi:hypothetical protein
LAKVPGGVLTEAQENLYFGFLDQSVKDGLIVWPFTDEARPSLREAIRAYFLHVSDEQTFTVAALAECLDVAEGDLDLAFKRITPMVFVMHRMLDELGPSAMRAGQARVN